MRTASASEHARKILEAIADECIECELCSDVCTLLNDLELSPAQIARLVLDGEVSRDLLEAIQRCDLCGHCGFDCPSEINVPGGMMAAREILLKNGMISLDDYRIMLVDQDWHLFTIYRDTYGIDFQDLKREHYETLFFPGCTLASYSPELTRATYAWLQDQGMTLGITDMCCGKPLASIGLRERDYHLVDGLKQQMDAAGAKQLVTACPNCYHHLRERLEGIDIVSLYGLLRQAGIRPEGNNKLTVHDSCPDRFDGRVGKEVRSLLSGYPLVEMKHHGPDSICCGSGGIVSMVDPELAHKRTLERIVEFEATDAAHCITSCMACAHRLSRATSPGNVLHCLEMVFGIFVDYAQVEANIQAMWEGEWGEYNLHRLMHARLISMASETKESNAST
jgi:fumarate reductase (CoM/CoB) subunit B